MTPARFAASLGLFVAALGPIHLSAQTVQIVVDASKGRSPVSPYLYGKNDGTGTPDSPLTAAGWQRFRDAGLRMMRTNGGNNGTKYNWQKKLTSHPDWYNNVYASMDWDYAQRVLQENLPGVQSMWCFQLLGKVADNTAHNFNDWNYNQSQWWSGVGQNLAGGGTVNPAGGSTALKEGDPSLYLTDTSPEISTAILDHWIKSSGLKLDRTQFRYWNMDNEPEIWEGTHNDVMKSQLPAEEFMQRYFAYAKKARARYPEIKLVGPVPANEWQWFNYPNGSVSDGKAYCWLEFFIKRIGEEQARTGVRLLDVLDVHFYPGATDPATIVQLHRIFFDPTFVNPEANGVHGVNGGWDTSINSEYVFARCQEWLVKYLGPKHGVTFGLTECGLALDQPPVTAVWYASTLGEFMKNGVEVFTPWSWQTGMWEVLHLYSRYNYGTTISGSSDDETTVSAYPTVDEDTGNATVVLVNRALTQTRNVTVSLQGLSIPDRGYTTLQLSDLPGAETFVSHTSNALKTSSVGVSGNRFSMSLPPLSVTSVLLRPHADVVVTPPPSSASRLANLSVRARSGSSDDVLIVGLVVGGSGSKQVLLRGIGPALKKLGVSTALTDSTLTLFDRQSVAISANDDWASDAAAATALRSLFSTTGAFSLDDTSADAALAPVVTPGPYTFHVRGKGGTQGVALGEVYDADFSGSTRLVNVAARTWVGTDADVLIAGFVISGPAPKTVLIRGVGPGLIPYGVSNTLADPVLRVYRQGVDAPIFQNDDWGTTSYADEIVSTAQRIGAAALAGGSKDAILLLTLQPGIYTAIVSGAGNTSGVGMVEVFEVE